MSWGLRRATPLRLLDGRPLQEVLDPQPRAGRVPLSLAPPHPLPFGSCPRHVGLFVADVGHLCRDSTPEGVERERDEHRDDAAEYEVLPDGHLPETE